MNAIRLGLILLIVSIFGSACTPSVIPAKGLAVGLKCDCRCVEETDGVSIAGDIRLDSSITETGLCAGHIGNDCTTNADVPPGGIVNGTITECQAVIVPASL
jgi:hypothetical protein